MKTDNVCKDIAEDAEKRFDTSDDEIDRPLRKRKHKNVIGLTKDDLRGKIMMMNIKKQKVKMCHKKKT